MDMELKDFTEKEQEQINQGLSTAEISDKEAARSCSLLSRKNGSSVFLSLSEGMRQQRRSNVWLCAILNSMPWPSAKETFLKKNGKNCVSLWQNSLKKRWTNIRLNKIHYSLKSWIVCQLFFATDKLFSFREI